MSRFIINPNLPQSDVVLAAVGEIYINRLEEGLNRQGIDIIPVPKADSLDDRLSCHADLSLLHMGHNSLCISQEVMKSSFINRLNDEGFIVSVSEVSIGALYPDDCRLNVCIADKHFICGKNVVLDSIQSRLVANSLEPIYVNQGYAKCCTCLINESCAITSDTGIYSALRKNGFDVLLISPGGILLEGFNYGFIGGASFLSSGKKLCFTGDFRYFEKEEKRKILSFLDTKHIEHCFLTNGPMFDIGGIIQLKEKENSD